MKTSKRVLGKIAVLGVLFALMFPAAVFADARGTLSIDGGGAAQVGTQVGVTVTLKGQDRFGESDMFIDYDTEKLQFVSGDIDSQEGGRLRLRGLYPNGTDQQTWNLQFQTVAEGSATVNASDVWVKMSQPDENGDEVAQIDVSTATFEIGPAAAGAASPVAGTVPQTDQGQQPAVSQAPTPEPGSMEALEQQIANDGTMSALVSGQKWMVQENFPDELIPQFFQASTQFYKGVEVKAAKLNNAEYYLLYVISEDGTQAKFCAYDGATKHFSDILPLQTDQEHILYVVLPGEVPSYFERSDLTVGTTTYPAWQITSNLRPAYAADPYQFYLVCAYDQNGEGGWHVYDFSQNIAMRYVEFIGPAGSEQDGQAEESAQTAQPEEKDISAKYDFLMNCIKYIAIILIAAILLLLIINLSDRRSRKKAKKEAEEAKRLAKKEKGAGFAPLKEEPKKAEEPKEAAKRDPDEFVDDYEESLLAEEEPPKTEEEEKAVGVLKPLSGEEPPVQGPEEKPLVQKAEKEEAPVQEPEKKSPVQEPEEDLPVQEPEEEPLILEPDISANLQKETADSVDMHSSLEEASRKMEQSISAESQKASLTDEDFEELTFLNLDD